jgi:Tfp pilus assembly pilus retraction ATPase PilT
MGRAIMSTSPPQNRGSAEGPQRLDMKALFEYAAEVGASDLLITAGSPPVVRIDGVLQPATDQALTAEQTHKLIGSLLNETQQEMFERKRELDFSLGVSGRLRFRANIYHQKGAVAGAFRVVPRHVPNLSELGAPPLLAVVAQQLIPRADGNGRVLATEILVRNHAVAHHIREGKTHQTRATMESSKSDGMVTMDDRLQQLYHSGFITFDEMARRISSPTVLSRLKSQRSGGGG